MWTDWSYFPDRDASIHVAILMCLQSPDGILSLMIAFARMGFKGE